MVRYTSVNRIVIFLLACLLLMSCANKPLLLTKDSKLEDLHICLDFADHIEGNEKLLYLNSVITFIEDYNHSKQRIRLLACTKGEQRSLHVIVQNTRFIDPQKQFFYVAISVAGIVYPLSGGGIGFVWFAMNGTSLQLQLSSDLGGEHKPVYRYYTSWPYFHDLETIKIKHMEEFQVFMRETLADIENHLELIQSDVIDV